MRFRPNNRPTPALLYVGCFILSLIVGGLAGFAYVMTGRTAATDGVTKAPGAMAGSASTRRVATGVRGGEKRSAAKTGGPGAANKLTAARNPTIIAQVDIAAAEGPSSASASNIAPTNGEHDRDLDPSAMSEPWVPQHDTWRTVCVRLCDGALTPVSFATTRERFAADQSRCTSQCGSPSRLFIMPPNGTPEDLVDLVGGKYTELSTAFLYRSSFDPECTCRRPSRGFEAEVAGLAVGLSGPIGTNATPSGPLDVKPTPAQEFVAPVAEAGAVVAGNSTGTARPAIVPTADDRGASQPSQIVQAVLAIAAAAPYPQLSRGAARGSDTVAVEAAVPMQAQGSVAQTRGKAAKLHGKPPAVAEIALPVAVDGDAAPTGTTEAKLTKVSAKAVAGLKRSARVNVTSAARSTPRALRAQTIRLAARSTRGGMQRAFTSPDYWRVSYWHAN